VITAGIDVGAKWVKVVVLRDGEVIGRARALTGFEQTESAKTAFDDALRDAGLTAERIDAAAATGAGRRDAPGNPIELTEVTAAAIGAVHVVPSARTVIDVGAEEGRAIKVTAEGKVSDFAGITYFNYAESGTEEGQALIGFECADRTRLLGALEDLHYPHHEIEMGNLLANQ